MNKPVFKYARLCYIISAILSIPLLIDMCTACHLFSLWIAWLLFILICIVSSIRLWFGFKQHLYKFSWGLIGQLLLGAAVLIFFQLSVNRVIDTPVSHPVTPAVVDITDPFLELDSVHKSANKKHQDHRIHNQETETHKSNNKKDQESEKK
ncbi:MAG: hypothetical protein J1F38_09585 [Muribaculaceae bacterium]|nr:hypothetical protein [Muribaculaceae bacterium]